MNRPLVYLAVPYSHPDPKVSLYRFDMVNKAAAELTRQGLTVFSPISQSHPIATSYGLPVDWGFWEKFDRNFLSCCNTLYVLKLDGWEKSHGVQSEIAIAKEMGIDIIYITP